MSVAGVVGEVGSVTDWPQEFCCVMCMQSVMDEWSEIGQVLRNLEIS